MLSGCSISGDEWAAILLPCIVVIFAVISIGYFLVLADTPKASAPSRSES